MCHYSIKAP
jgi:hypothetical protein